MARRNVIDGRSASTACVLVIIALTGAHDARAAEPEFEVAAVRPKDPAMLAHARKMGPLVFDGFGTVREFIGLAYQTEPAQILGGPEWASSLVYYIHAKAPEESSPEQIRKMLASLLRTRFQLRIHNDSRPISAYVLETDPKGLRLKPAQEDTPRDGLGAIQKTAQGAIARGSTTALLARFIGHEPGSPVVDSTGLDGSYDFDLTYDSPQDADGEFGSIYSALKQLGLKLELKKPTLPVISIDAVEHPDPN
jgi:uncharacterized protein (TIGR03435 family)